MLESSLSMAVTQWADKTKVDGKYYQCLSATQSD